MNDPRDPLDAALGALPQNVQPPRDLWAGIHAQIAADEAHSFARERRSFTAGRWGQLAAAVVLAIAASALTYVVTLRSMQDQPQLAQEAIPAPVLSAMPASFSGELMGADYVKARAALDAEFEQRIALLPPVTRARLQNDLADLRRAANDIAATLAQHPSDPLLQDLLMSTYQSELQLFANVNEMTARSLRTDL